MRRTPKAALAITFSVALAFACQGNVGSPDSPDDTEPVSTGGAQGTAGTPASGGASAGAGGTSAGAGGSSPIASGGSAGTGTGCAADQLTCNGACVVPATDNAHCGACNNACPAGSSCVQGACSCPGGGVLCAGSCVDTNSDAANCGACGAACEAGRVCLGGSCQCPQPLASCGGACVDLTSDAANCGTCGTACATGQVCSQGQCGLGCAGGEAECGQSCVNLQTNNAHCGACGSACSGGRQCSGGTCQCPGGQQYCNNQCRTVASDAAHCGGCNVACATGQSCNGGSCQCPSGQALCAGSCVSTANNPAHCGACNNACASGTCSNGACTPVAATGPIGWATVNGNTTGGSGGSVVNVSNASDLTSAVSGNTARIVQITGTISVADLRVGSNKTLIGMNNNVTINGGIRLSGVSNVIIQNLKINARSSGAAGDGMNIQNSHHIWVDHCEIWDAPDGNLDITNGANYITVSWTKFWYSSNPPDNGHRFSNLIGAGDDVTSDENALNITWHHNWWAERVHERMPRIRFGDVHVFNNYFSSSGNNYCIRAGFHAKVVVENNYFQGVGTTRTRSTRTTARRRWSRTATSTATPADLARRAARPSPRRTATRSTRRTGSRRRCSRGPDRVDRHENLIGGAPICINRDVDLFGTRDASIRCGCTVHAGV
jgi:pectate lyase